MKKQSPFMTIKAKETLKEVSMTDITRLERSNQFFNSFDQF